MGMENLKRCRKCGEVKPATLEYFSPIKARKSGLHSECRVCVYAKNKLWRENNPDKYRESCRKWRQANPDKARENERRWQLANADRKRKNERRWRYANLEKARERVRLWNRNNPDKARSGSNNRRARKLKNGGTHTAADIRAQYNSQDGNCWWCGNKIIDVYHVDHIVPLSRGGSNAAGNLVIACPRCNLSKGAKMPHEWSGRLL